MQGEPWARVMGEGNVPASQVSSPGDGLGGTEANTGGRADCCQPTTSKLGSTGLGKHTAVLMNLGRFRHVSGNNNQVSTYQHSFKWQIISINLPNKFISHLHGLEKVCTLES